MPIYLVCDGCEKDLGTTIEAKACTNGLVLCPDCRTLVKYRDELVEMKRRVATMPDNLESSYRRSEDVVRLREIEDKLGSVVDMINIYVGFLPF